jgi:predicted NAD/FAD-binding protein
VADERTWEVSIVVSTYSRIPVARDVPSGPALVEAYLRAHELVASGEYPHPTWRTGAVLVQRSDQTLEARRERWDQEFYDRDRRGYRRRRYKKPSIERDWEAMEERRRKEARVAAQSRNAGRERRGGVN